MNYIKPEQIKAYVERNPEGIAGMSKDLATMVNHFAELIVRECAITVQDFVDHRIPASEYPERLKKHFEI